MIHEIIPAKDKQKLKFLKEMKLQSSHDGVIVKGDDFRLSFSCGERKVISLYPQLYTTLKYLNKCAETNFHIPSYLLKEIFCSYIVHKGSKGLPLHKDSLSTSLAELISFARRNPISSPFYITRLGSSIHKDCSLLFDEVEQHLPQEFQQLQQTRLGA